MASLKIEKHASAVEVADPALLKGQRSDRAATGMDGTLQPRVGNGAALSWRCAIPFPQVLSSMFSDHLLWN